MSVLIASVSLSYHRRNRTQCPTRFIPSPGGYRGECWELAYKQNVQLFLFKDMSSKLGFYLLLIDQMWQFPCLTILFQKTDIYEQLPSILMCQHVNPALLVFRPQWEIYIYYTRNGVLLVEKRMLSGWNPRCSSAFI